MPQQATTTPLIDWPWDQDQHDCVSPVLATFGRQWADDLAGSYKARDRLGQYVPLLPGTAGDDEADARRRWLALDWLVRECASGWLFAAGLDAEAEALADLGEITDAESAQAARPALQAARTAMRPPWPPTEISRAAAWAVSRSAGMAATQAATPDYYTTTDDRAALWAVGRAAWDVSWSAAAQALEPTVARLQASAHDLYRRMIQEGRS